MQSTARKPKKLMIQRSDDRPTTPTVVSLFSGAGGLDYGFEAAGFETRLSLEMDEDCCRSIQRNRKWPLIEDRVENVTSTHMLEVASLRPGEVEICLSAVLLANPSRNLATGRTATRSA